MSSRDEDYFNSVHDIENFVNDVVLPIIHQFEQAQRSQYDDGRYSIIVELFKVVHAIMRNNGWSSDDIAEYVVELEEELGSNKPTLH